MSESIPLDEERDTSETDTRTSGGADPGYDAVAQRAYEIFESGEGGSPQENWERAERELRDEESG